MICFWRPLMQIWQSSRRWSRTPCCVTLHRRNCCFRGGLPSCWIIIHESGEIEMTSCWLEKTICYYGIPLFGIWIGELIRIFAILVECWQSLQVNHYIFVLNLCASTLTIWYLWFTDWLHAIWRSWTLMPPDNLTPDLADKATRIQVLPETQAMLR